MLPIDKLDTPGEHPFFFNGAAGRLEAILTTPLVRNSARVAFLGHPHSLKGGTMTNKVVTTMARAFKELGIPSLRFNFRGVGESAGVYDNGIGESEDMLTLLQLWIKAFPDSCTIIAGFSFGSYVAYRVAAQAQPHLLITIAPPVHHFDYLEFSPAPKPWYIFQGDCDEVVPLADVVNFAAQSSPPVPIIHFPETGHFFHGNLLRLKAELIALVNNLDILS